MCRWYHVIVDRHWRLFLKQLKCQEISGLQDLSVGIIKVAGSEPSQSPQAREKSLPTITEEVILFFSPESSTPHPSNARRPPETMVNVGYQNRYGWDPALGAISGNCKPRPGFFGWNLVKIQLSVSHAYGLLEILGQCCRLPCREI